MVWNQSTLGMVAPATVTAIVDAMGSLQTAVSTLLAMIRAGVVFAKITASTEINPLLLALKAICDAIIADLETLETGGVSTITVSPLTYGVNPLVYNRSLGLMGLTTLENMITNKRALEDEGDLLRPHGVGDYGALISVISGTAPDVMALMDVVDGLASVFSQEDLKKLSAKVRGIMDKETLIETIESTAPDYKGISLADMLPSYASAIATTKAFVQGIRDTTANSLDALDEIIDFLDKKEQDIVKIQSTWNDYLDKLAIAIPSSGFYWQYIPPQAGGADLIKNAFADTASFPTAWATHDYSIVNVIAGGGPVSLIGEMIGQ